MNTLLASAIAGLFVVILKPYILKTRSPSSKYDVSNLCNGILVGCVSITGACDRCENWAAIIIGVVSAFFYIGGCAFISKFKIDDPVEACCVHAFGGVWGVIAVGIFDNTKGIIYPIEGRGYFLGMQIAGLVTIIGWTSVLTFLYFGLFKLLKVDRVSISHELMGCDIAEMGALNKKLLLKMKIEVLASE